MLAREPLARFQREAVQCGGEVLGSALLDTASLPPPYILCRPGRAVNQLLEEARLIHSFEGLTQFLLPIPPFAPAPGARGQVQPLGR